MNVTATVSIGRNIGSKPMSAPRWGTFVHELGTFLTTLADSVFVDTDHVGEWDGVAEEGHTWVVLVDPAFIYDFERVLELLAEKYEQDAIALTVGDTTLVTPRASLLATV